MTPASDDQQTGAQAATHEEEDRLGKRRSFWGRMRNRLGMVGTATKNANEDPRTIGMQGDNPAWGNDSFR
jgi:hypothetical protein